MSSNDPTLTVSQIRHELSETVALLGTLVEGMKFLKSGSSNRILYLVDYPEIKAFWEARRPTSFRALNDDGVRRVADYLTGLERVFLSIDDDSVNLTYLNRAYYEQGEFIDALLRDGRFKTLLVSQAWEKLEDDIEHFAQFIKDPLVNWNAAIRQNETDLKSTVVSERNFIQTAENFGFGSAEYSQHETVFLLIKELIDHSNFCEAADYPWEELSGSGGHAIEVPDFKPSDSLIDYWAKEIDDGNRIYREAYSSSRRLWHREERAITLAHLEYLNDVSRRLAPTVRVALVTRNRQYHHVVLKRQKEGGAEAVLDKPLIFHPRLLGAFMINQTERRPTDADIGNVLELISAIRLVLDFLADIRGDGTEVAGPNLRNFVRAHLRRGWDTYRRQSLAEQVKARIEGRREERWGKRKAGDPLLAKFQQVVRMVLQSTQMYRELALIDALPSTLVLESGHVDYYLLRHNGGPQNWALLFTSRKFSHAFRFYSSHVAHAATQAEGNGKRRFDIQAVIGSARNIIDSGASKPDSDSLENLMLLRVDVLNLCAIWLATDGRADQARRFIEAAENIEGIPFSLNSFGQKQETFYLKCLLQRIEWRREAYVTQPGNDGAIGQLIKGAALLRAMDNGGRSYFPTLEGRQGNKRIAVLIAGFARELYAFAARHKVEFADWPMSVAECLSLLEVAYQESIRQGFYYTAMRARQRYMQFARMYDENRLPPGGAEGSDFSLRRRIECFRQLHVAMDMLRAQSQLEDEKFPFTAIVSETLGLWRYRRELEIGNREIATAVSRMRSITGEIPNAAFREEVYEILKEMDEFVTLDGQSGKGPDF
jgi:hypothetical protein